MARFRTVSARVSSRSLTVVVAALWCVAVGLSPAHAETAVIGGTLNYTGTLGPVSRSRPLCLCLYTDPDLQLEIGCAIYSSNNVHYQISLGSPSDYYLIAFLDLVGNESHDPNEPYEIYRDRAAPPADVVTAGPSQTHIDFTFGDENLPGAPTPTPLPTDTPTPTLTATPSEVATPMPTPTMSTCGGDCDGSGEVTINEIITMVNVALGTADLTACRAGDTNGSNDIEVNEIIQAVNNAAGGCAAALPLPSNIAALYDTSMTFDDQYSVNVLGWRTVSDSPTTLSFDIGPNWGLSLTGNEGADGQLELEGFGVVTDVGYQAHATAQRIVGPLQEQIEGEVHAEGLAAPFMSATFIMHRDATTPVPFSGMYRLDLSASPGDPQQASAVTVGLDVGASGVAIASGGTDTAGDGAVLGSLSSGHCLIASGGSLSCNAVYLVEGSNVSAPFRLTGKLNVTADGVTGVGAYLVGVDPPYNIYVPGRWTATRVGSSAS